MVMMVYSDYGDTDDDNDDDDIFIQVSGQNPTGQYPYMDKIQVAKIALCNRLSRPPYLCHAST